MSCLEIKAVFKMCQKCSMKSRLKSTLIFEVKLISCLEIKIKFMRTRNAPEPAFYNYFIDPKQRDKIYFDDIFHGLKCGLCDSSMCAV